MSTCTAGPGCRKTCPKGCGCISNNSGSDCHCACIDASDDPDAELREPLPDWAGLDVPMVICLQQAGRQALGDLLALSFPDRIMARAPAPASTLTLDRAVMTLRDLGGMVGLRFTP